MKKKKNQPFLVFGHAELSSFCAPSTVLSLSRAPFFSFSFGEKDSLLLLLLLWQLTVYVDNIQQQHA